MEIHIEAVCSNIEQGKELIVSIGRIVNCLKKGIDHFQFIWSIGVSKVDKGVLLKDLKRVGNDLNVMIKGDALIIHN